MKRIGFYIISCIILLNCQNERTEDSFILTGNIKGLKKGKLYLQHIKDTAFVTIDSIEVNGESNFTMGYEITEPEMLFLKLNKNDKEENMLGFFADKGATTINTSLKNFLYDAEIQGSKQQTLLEEYALINGRFNDVNLDLIKKAFESNGDSISSAVVEQDFKSLQKRKYLYTINFAYNHKDSEVSPYLAVSEIPDANIKYLDTIYNGLTPAIQNSKYGKLLKELISSRK